MTATIVTAVVLGCFAGLVPGPYTTMVAGTGLEKGFRAAVKLALTPLVTDVPPLLVTALVLESLSGTALSALGVAGGTIVAVVGIRFLRRHGPGASLLERSREREPGDAGPSTEMDTVATGTREPTAGTAKGSATAGPGQSATFGHVVLGTLLSPAPWIFWLVVGSPLMLRSWNRSELEGVLFVVILFATNIGTASWLAWIASHSRGLLTPMWRRRILRLAGTGLVLAGAFLVWQAVTGKFESLIRQQETVRSVVEEQTR